MLFQARLLTVSLKLVTRAQTQVCRVDESALTGESEDVVKDSSTNPFLRSGSRVLEGQGRLVVTAVGSNSQQGQIFGSLSSPSNSLRCASNSAAWSMLGLASASGVWGPLENSRVGPEKPLQNISCLNSSGF